MSNTQKIHDIIGIGIGPFNLGLAALLDQTSKASGLFFDENKEFQWHAGMLIDGTTMQVPFMADLVTMADPTSPYTFLQYLQEQERLYAFYFYEKFQIPRQEYNDYCRWTASKLPSCRFGRRVKNITYSAKHEAYEVEVKPASSETSEYYYSRHIAMGIGTKPSIPAPAKTIKNSKMCHSASYLHQKQKIQKGDSITVLGSGQSAAEVFLDLLGERPEHGYRLNWYTRSSGFFPMEYSKLGLEHFSPEYIRYFYNLDRNTKSHLLKKQDLLYKGISMDTIASIYDLLYEQTIGKTEQDIVLQARTEMTRLTENENGTLTLSLRELHTQKERTIETDALILATGYEPASPSFLGGIEQDLKRDENGQLVIDEQYRVTQHNKKNHLFVQNGEMHTHGVGAPDLGLGAHRNAVIINQLAGEEIYPVREKNVFQQFGWQQSS